jgi:hypothetical protein
MNQTKTVSDAFHIQNGLKQGDALWQLLFNFALVYAIWKLQETKRDWILMGRMNFCS